MSRLTIELTQARTALDEAKAQLNERITRIRELETSAEASMEKVAELGSGHCLAANVEERNDDLTVRESRLAEALTAKEATHRVRELEAEIGDTSEGTRSFRARRSPNATSASPSSRASKVPGARSTRTR